MVFIAGFFFTSCKKEGCTDAIAINYDSKAQKDNGTCVYPEFPTTYSLCDGISGNNKYVPLSVGYKWTYKKSIGSVSYIKTREVVGTEKIDGKVYFKVHSTDEQDGGEVTISYYRTDSNGDVYIRYENGQDILYMLGNPVVGKGLGNGLVVSSLNASISTIECSYTGCLELEQVTMFGTRKMYFKKGIGYLKYIKLVNEGDERLIAVSF